jgi:hypothetical protein
LWGVANDGYDFYIYLMANPYGIPENIFTAVKKIITDRTELSYAAGENLSGGRVVYLYDNRIFYYNPSDPKLCGTAIGMTKNAARIGENVKVQIAGKFYEQGLGLQSGKTYFVGMNGTLVLNPAGLKIVQSVGTALDENTIVLKFHAPIVTI